MTAAEKNACTPLLKPGVEHDDNGTNANPSSPLNLSSILKKKRKAREEAADEAKSKYVDCRFILSSAAIVEQLWSKADLILGNKCRSMTAPILVEAILFLSENRHLWDDVLVLEAIRKAKRDLKQQTLDRLNEEDNEDDEEDDIHQ